MGAEAAQRRVAVNGDVPGLVERFVRLLVDRRLGGEARPEQRCEKPRALLRELHDIMGAD